MRRLRLPWWAWLIIGLLTGGLCALFLLLLMFLAWLERDIVPGGRCLLEANKTPASDQPSACCCKQSGKPPCR